MIDLLYVLIVVFYRAESGNEPVREWLKKLSREDKRKIGEDIKTAQLGWPLGCRSSEKFKKICGKSAQRLIAVLRGFSSRLTANI